MDNTQVFILQADGEKLLRDSLNIELQNLAEQGYTVVSIECANDICHIWYE